MIACAIALIIWCAVLSFVVRKKRIQTELRLQQRADEPEKTAQIEGQ